MKLSKLVVFFCMLLLQFLMPFVGAAHALASAIVSYQVASIGNELVSSQNEEIHQLSTPLKSVQSYELRRGALLIVVKDNGVVATRYTKHGAAS